MPEKESEKKPVAAKKDAKPKTEASKAKTTKAKVAAKPKAEVSKKEPAKPKAPAKPKKKVTSEISVTLKKSGIGKAKDQKATIKGLGFKRLNQTVTLKDTPSVRGMINKISHLVEVQ